MAVAVQPDVYVANNRKEIQCNLDHYKELIDGTADYFSQLYGPPCKLIAFPEWFLHGYAIRPISEWLKIAIKLPGEESDQLGERAVAWRIYIVGAAFVIEPEWPDRCFNVAFIIGPDGKVIHRFHKVHTAVPTEMSTSPGDIYDEFVKKYGDTLDAFFPVTETEIGKIGTFICNDGSYPETSRALAMNGAEILVRPTAWPEPFLFEPMPHWELQNRYAAAANACYFVAPNWAMHLEAPGLPKGLCPGVSQIIDYRGRILAQSRASTESFTGAEINVQNLRVYRRDALWLNWLPQIRTEIFRKIYETTMWPKNKFLEKTPNKESFEEAMKEFVAIQREVYKRRNDIFTPPK